MFENPRRGRQAKNFATNVPKILDLKSSSEQIFFRKLSLGAPDIFSDLLCTKSYVSGLVYTCKEGFLSHVCLIYVICFCNLRMWKDLNKNYLTSIKLCVSSFLYGPRANIIGTEVMGFIYTGFRPSHFEVMAVTDIKLVFIQILSYSQVTETIVFLKVFKKTLKVCVF